MTLIGSLHQRHSHDPYNGVTSCKDNRLFFVTAVCAVCVHMGVVLCNLILPYCPW